MAGRSIPAQSPAGPGLQNMICRDAMWFFNRQSGAVFWAKLFRRKTDLSTGRISKSSQSFEIIKRRMVSNTAGWTILSSSHLNVELTSSLLSHSCVSREYTWNDNDFFFSPAFPLVPTWYRNSNQSILREGYYAESTEQRNVWHGGIRYCKNWKDLGHQDPEQSFLFPSGRETVSDWCILMYIWRISWIKITR